MIAAARLRIRILPIVVSFGVSAIAPAAAEMPTSGVSAAAPAFTAPTIDPTAVWEGKVGRWSNRNNWNPERLPEATDRVLIGNGGTATNISFNVIDAAVESLTIYRGDAATADLISLFWQSPATSRSLLVSDALVVGGAIANQQGAFLLSGGTLSTKDTWVVSTPADGSNGFRQTGGTHTVSNRLILSPVEANARAQYTLSDGALVSTSTILDAQSGGVALFSQQGGFHATQALEVGLGATYAMQGTGRLAANTVTNAGSISVDGGRFAAGNLANSGEFSIVG